MNKFVKIIYEDKDLIVIVKSEGILSMASAPGQYCVKTILDEYFKSRHFPCTAHVVHRLDKETSGLMVYAKNMEIRKMFEADWHNIVFDRRYVAVMPEKLDITAMKLAARELCGEHDFSAFCGNPKFKKILIR